MRFVFISDTHGFHEELSLPDGDFLIHAGDLSPNGKVSQLQVFMDWFVQQPHRHKIFVAGNHDYLAERNPQVFMDMIPPGIHYLNDSGVELEGIHFWGSPVQPWFLNWAFNRQRGKEIAAHWQLIPSHTDVLITHGPPKGILDGTARGEQVGCEELTAYVARIRPKIHVFGHIHEAYGQLKQAGTHFINASVLNLRYQLVNDPVVVDWEACEKSSDGQENA